MAFTYLDAGFEKTETFLIFITVKILLLSDTFSEHTEKWALSLANRGLQIGLFSFNKASYEWYNHPNITIFFEPEAKINAESTLTKLAYLKYVSILKKIIKHFQPDILHAHYATSYGFVGALSGFHPYIISSWGSDVMKFPHKNFVAKSILKYNFRSADVLCATSYVIKDYISKISVKPVSVIPFGIDPAVFKPYKRLSPFGEGHFVVGCIKSLEAIYKIDVLIKAFAALEQNHPQLRLMLIGHGAQAEKLQQLVKELKLEEKVVFTGRIPFSEVADYYNMLDVLVNISEYESFGVSVIEAMACGKPVVVSNVGGLIEIVENDTLGLKVNVNAVDETAQAIERLMTDPVLYASISENAKKHVAEKYNWEKNLSDMIKLYEDTKQAEDEKVLAKKVKKDSKKN